jgi:hypothetical protein
MIRSRKVIEAHAPRLRRVSERARAVLVSDGTVHAWVPRAPLRNTSEPDVLSVAPWFRPKPEAAPMFQTSIPAEPSSDCSNG